MADWMAAVVESTLGTARAYKRVGTPVRTPTGGTTMTWADAGFSYCNIAPMDGEEIELAGKMSARGTVSCRVRKDFDVDQGDTIRVEGTGMDELDGTWQVTAILVTSPVVDRLLFLARSS